MPYASQLFGDTPQATLQGARDAVAAGFAAVKFGWGPIGRADARADAEHFVAAREGLGPDGVLLVDVGQIWGEDVEAAAARLPALEVAGATWLEEPFHTAALSAYHRLTQRGSPVKLAGGEGAHNVAMALHLMEYGSIGFIQIDCGRIGGIGPAKVVVDEAVARGITFVNHTFTSHLALSASLQPFAGLADHRICEYPFAPKTLALELTVNQLTRDAKGEVAAPDAPGLGITIDIEAVRGYLQEVEIKVNGRVLYATPTLKV